MKKFLLILPLCCWLTAVPALNVDSLWGLWNDKTQPDTVRLRAMHNICWSVYLYSQPDSAFYLAGLEYKLAEAAGNINWMAAALNTQGATFFLQGNYEYALAYFQKGLMKYEEIGDKTGLAATYNNIGSIYQNQGNVKQALLYYGKSLQITEAIGDKKRMADSYNNMGVISMFKRKLAKIHVRKSHFLLLACFFADLKPFLIIGQGLFITALGIVYSPDTIVRGCHSHFIACFFADLKPFLIIGQGLLIVALFF